MDREDVLDSIRANIEDKNLVKHMLATEAVMRALARHLGEDEEEWGLTGLLHDIDAELTDGDMSCHSKLGADLARELGATEVMAHAILSHNARHGLSLESKLDRALFCADPLTGLIVAAAMVQPDRRLDGLEPELVMQRLEENVFTAGADHERIARCCEIGLELDQFVAMGVTALKTVAAELEL